MITKWQLFNFKSVREAVDLELGPLTIFAGSNSSGKSTILQSMLLVSQTLSSKVSSRSVVLNGPMLRLGQFDDLRSFDSSARYVEIGWQCHPISTVTPLDADDISDYNIRNYLLHRGRLLDAVDCRFSFYVDDDQEISQLRPGLRNCEVRVSSEDTSPTRDKTQQIKFKIERSKSQAKKMSGVGDDQKSQALLPSLDYDVIPEWPRPEPLPFIDEFEPDNNSRPLVGCTLDHFLPQRQVVKYNINRERALMLATFVHDPDRFRRIRAMELDWVVPPTILQWVERQIGGADRSPRARISKKGITIEDLFMEARFNAPKRNQSSKPTKADLERLIKEAEELLSRDSELGAENGKFALILESLPRLIDEGISYLEKFFSTNVKYLGPLRDEPKPLYPLAPSVDPSDIGLRGEYTASVLDLYKNRRVDYIPPRNLASAKDRVNPIKESLKAAALDWLQYMGVVEELMTEDRGKLGHELKVTTQGTKMPHDLTHVGVGVSQVLPILVICLLAEPDTTIIIEQPELHLHPKVQTLLGDFFLSMALLNKQIIVETHSEYIISRLRYRAASAEGEQIASLMKIYFAEKKEGSSVFRSVKVNQYGAIMDWPEGFFDQSQAEADRILRSAIEKKERSRKSRLEKRDG